ncbi:hypothetical protein BDK51DRAFT_49092 [Blyttiomyces helicus]|uniref:Uncharacterized protein n=1 Tax=Blyttiomyces helicus TaxID=388810 RepID=A0A4P9VYR8_9FUNG|nr:hypothetical protein BDK51DRAFT_49092 [Blyttiomyces helicus]|eukprot:RKO84422.1 hypothetical protein BDK51DRAFT_49092 [Blyttiomyces helicus]
MRLTAHTNTPSKTTLPPGAPAPDAASANTLPSRCALPSTSGDRACDTHVHANRTAAMSGAGTATRTTETVVASGS